MNNEQSTTGNIITNAFNKWADKVWFQVLFAVIVFYLLAAPIATPLITNYYQQINTSKAVNETLDNRDLAQIEAHKLAFERSKQSYALAKKEMTDYMPLIDCEYVFLLEYHNGSENVMTGIQFCKFDITLEVGDRVAELVNQDKFRNENIAKYDILLGDELSGNKVIFYTQNSFEKVDKYLALQLRYLEAQSYAVVSLKDRDNKAFGALLCVSKNEHMNTLEVMSLAREVEIIMNRSGLKQEKNN